MITYKLGQFNRVGDEQVVHEYELIGLSPDDVAELFDLSAPEESYGVSLTVTEKEARELSKQFGIEFNFKRYEYDIVCYEK